MYALFEEAGKFLAGRVMNQGQMILFRGAKLGILGDGKGLKRAAVEEVGLEAELGEFGGDEVGRLIQPVGADAAAFQLIGREIFHITQEPRLAGRGAFFRAARRRKPAAQQSQA